MQGIVHFIELFFIFVPYVMLFAMFATTLVLHGVAWVREKTFGAYPVGNCRQIAINAIGYIAMSVLLSLLYVVTFQLRGMLSWLSIIIFVAFFMLSERMGLSAINRKPSAPAFAQTA